MYQLVFKGQCAPGVAVSVARANVAQVFKANTAQLDRMFSGDRVVIRNKLDNEAAGKYQSALAKQGIIVHIEPMNPPADGPAPAVAATASSAVSAPAQAPVRPASGTPASTVKVEPGERLPVAGERVDELLTGSSLTLGSPGETLGQPRVLEEPVFQNLEKWSIAPPGERLVDPAEPLPMAVPDVSHLELLPPGTRG